MTKIAKKTITSDAVTFAFEGNAGVDTYNIHDLPKEMVIRLALHGWAQKGGDSYASKSSPFEARDGVRELWECLKENQWTVKGEGRSGIWFEAFARATGESIETALNVWVTLDDAKKKAVMADSRVKKAKLEIEKERLEKMEEDMDTDGEDILANLFAE